MCYMSCVIFLTLHWIRSQRNLVRNIIFSARCSRNVVSFSVVSKYCYLLYIFTEVSNFFVVFGIGKGLV